jgi:hypothetical protein
MICNTLAADYYPERLTRSGVVKINRIVDGHRSHVMTFRVSGKREARQVAKSYGAKPWNF